MACEVGGSVCSVHNGAHLQCYAHGRCISLCWPDQESNRDREIRNAALEEAANHLFSRFAAHDWHRHAMAAVRELKS